MFDQNKCISSSVLICLLKKKTDYVLLISYWSPDVCSSDLPEVTGPVMLVGFCYGGGVAFNVAAIEPVDALVSFYGSALPNLLELAPQRSEERRVGEGCVSTRRYGRSPSYKYKSVNSTIKNY